MTIVSLFTWLSRLSHSRKGKDWLAFPGLGLAYEGSSASVYLLPVHDSNQATLIHSPALSYGLVISYWCNPSSLSYDSNRRAYYPYSSSMASLSPNQS